RSFTFERDAPSNTGADTRERWRRGRRDRSLRWPLHAKAVESLAVHIDLAVGHKPESVESRLSTPREQSGDRLQLHLLERPADDLGQDQPTAAPVARQQDHADVGITLLMVEPPPPRDPAIEEEAPRSVPKLTPRAQLPGEPLCTGRFVEPRT